jgi:hypothetical protein
MRSLHLLDEKNALKVCLYLSEKHFWSIYSNLGWDVGYHDIGFPWFCQSLQANVGTVNIFTTVSFAKIYMR